MANAIEIRKALLAGNQNKVEQELHPYTFHRVGTKNNPRVECTVGGFCVAVPYYDDNNHPVKILRIMFNCNPDSGKRAQIVREYLLREKLPYFVSFQYYNNVLDTKDGPLDGFIMDYVDGEDLIYWIKNICNDSKIYESTRKKRINTIAKRFREMCIDLYRAKISHGDLSGANIRVTTEEELALIDYDSICIPDLIGANYTTTGDGAFNHPNRISSKMSLKIDYFAEIIIYISLLALSKNPQLWKKYHSDEIDLDAAILITQSDIENLDKFRRSVVYQDLYNLSSESEDISEMLGKLCESLSPGSTPESIPFPFLADTTAPPESTGNGDQSQQGTDTTSPTGTSTPTGTQNPSPNPTRPRPVQTTPTVTPWYKEWYTWVGAAILMAFLYFTFGKSDCNKNAGEPVKKEVNVSTAIGRLEGNYTLREKNAGVLVNGIRTAAIKKTSDTQARILVVSEYEPEIYEFSLDASGSIESEQLGKGEITYNEKLDKITLTFKQGERICELTK